MLNIFMWREDSTRAFWLIETKSWSVNFYRVRKNIGSFNPKISLFWRLLCCVMIVIVAIFLNRKLSELYMVYWLFTHDLRCAHFDYVPVIACIRFLKFIRFFIANILSKKSGSFFYYFVFFLRRKHSIRYAKIFSIFISYVETKMLCSLCWWCASF